MTKDVIQINPSTESDLIFEEAKPYLETGKGWPVTVTAYSSKTRMVTLTLPAHQSEQEYKENIAYLSLFLGSLRLAIISVSYNTYLPYMGNQDYDSLVVVFNTLNSELDVTTYPYTIADGSLVRVEGVNLNTAVNPVDADLLSVLKIGKKINKAESYDLEIVIEFLESKGFGICFYDHFNAHNIVIESLNALDDTLVDTLIVS